MKSISGNCTLSLPATPAEVQRTDAEIARAVWDAFLWNGLAPLKNDVQVTVEDGWVTLDGRLEWQYQMEFAENFIRQLVGVKGITNDLVILEGSVQSDAENDIAETAAWSASGVCRVINNLVIGA